MTALDTIARLIEAADHPDIASVERYGPDMQSILVTYQSRAKAFLWPVVDRVTATPADMPSELPEYKFRAQHALKLAVDLLEAAKPDGMVWRTVSVEGVPQAPCGLEVRTGGQAVLIRVTSGGAPGPDTDPADFAGWTIPAGLA